MQMQTFRHKAILIMANDQTTLLMLLFVLTALSHQAKQGVPLRSLLLLLQNIRKKMKLESSFRSFRPATASIVSRCQFAKRVHERQIWKALRQLLGLGAYAIR